MLITYGVGWNEYVARLMLNTLLVKYIIRLGLLVMNGLYATILLKHRPHCRQIQRIGYMYLF